MCTLALVIRLGTFFYYVQEQERFMQPDSNDYHTSAICMKYGYGMHYPNGRPIFWRTPGYPLYLSHFYKQTATTTMDVRDHKESIYHALMVQMLLCSLLPFLLFQLALTLTGSLTISWLLALVSIGHLGFVLASTFLLTDALAMLLFVLFLLFFYKSFRLWREPVPSLANNSHSASSLTLNFQHNYHYVILAALSLSAYTWMRPMGQFVAIVAILLYLFSDSTMRVKLKKIFIFFTLFSVTIFPWFWRNHQLTGSWFFCPLFGLYFNVFNAPKILARTANIPLKQAHTELTQAAGRLTLQEHKRLLATQSKHVYCGELICLQTAWPIIAAHPGYFLYDWMAEVIKTTFDLYSCQLAAFAGNCFSWDPLVEYLDEKLTNCLCTQPMPLWMRVTAWLELLASLITWLGILAGIFFFILQPLWQRTYALLATYGALWIKTGLLIGAVVMQTGGFGYARLRLPIEPLMLLIGITFWYWVFTQRNKKSV